MARPSPDDELKNFQAAKALRQPYEADWRTAAAHVLPRQWSSWTTDGPVNNLGRQGAKRFAYDNTGVNALPKFKSLLSRLVTPNGTQYVQVRCSNELMKYPNVKMWCEQVSDLLDMMRKVRQCRTVQAEDETYQNIGVYGCGPSRISWRKKSPIDDGGLMHKAVPLRDFYTILDDDGNPCGSYLRFWLNARQFKMKWPDVPVPKSIRAQLDMPAGPKEDEYFEFVHAVRLRTNDDYAPDAFNARKFPFVSSYLACKDCEYVGDEEGFLSLPYIMPRISSEAGDPYGYSPAMQASPALGGVNAMKKTIIRMAHKAVDPPLLANDDGAISGRIGITPGYVNYGGLDSQGRELVKALATGSNFQVAEDVLKDERGDINAAFFADLYGALQDAPEMTATQFVSFMAEKTSILIPVMGRLQLEYLGPRTERELDLLAEHNMMPKLPPELVEAKGEYQLQYTSPLARAIYADELAGFMQLKDMLIEVAQATQDPTKLAWINWDVAIPEVAEGLGAKARWINFPDQVAAAGQAQRDQQTQDNIIKQAPAIASVAKASMDNNNAGGMQQLRGMTTVQMPQIAPPQ